MPLFNSQLTSNSPLQMIAPGDPAGVVLFNAETPANGQASIAVAIQPRTASSGPTTVSLQFECPLGLGAGVFQIQDSDGPTLTEASNFTSINFGGGTPGQVVLANMNASGVSRVELQTAARGLRVLCVTAPGNPITVRARQQ
jgi:hypothetical protein